MACYGFCFRASTRREGGEGSLYLRVVHDGQSRSITTEHRIRPEEWDQAGRRLRIPIDRKMSQNAERRQRLVDIESSMLCDMRRLEMVIERLERGGGRYSVDDIMTRYRTMVSGSSLAAFAEKLAARIEREGRHRTAAAYRTAAARLCEFTGMTDLNYNHITPTLLAEFQRSLKTAGLRMNSISFYMRTLRAIYNKAVAEGVIHRHGESIFAGVYTGVSPTRKRALSPGDLAVLSAFDPTDVRAGSGVGGAVRGDRSSFDAGAEADDGLKLPEPLAQALAMFLFCYHARGMCFVDMAHLRQSDIRGDVIRYRRAKTGQQIELMVGPEMRAIIDWFRPRTTGSPFLFPVIGNPRGHLRRQYESGLRLQNQRLKRVAAMCGVHSRLTTHVARHSWATVAKGYGFPLAVISEGLGHSNQRTTEIYLASLERPVLDHASRVVSQAIRGGAAGVGAGPGGFGGGLAGSGGLPLTPGVWIPHGGHGIPTGWRY